MYTKRLIQLNLNEIVLDSALRICESKERKDLQYSLSQKGLLNSLVVVLFELQYFLLQGFSRYDALYDKNGGDFKIDVLLIDGVFTWDQIIDLIPHFKIKGPLLKQDLLKLDAILSKKYSKGQGFRTDLLDNPTEFDLLSTDEKVATMLGISVSQLTMLRSIQKTAPSLLEAIDSGHLTLINARKQVQAIKTAQDGKQRNYQAGKEIICDLLPGKCSTCGQDLKVDLHKLDEIFAIGKGDNDSLLPYSPSEGVFPIPSDQTEELQSASWLQTKPAQTITRLTPKNNEKI